MHSYSLRQLTGGEYQYSIGLISSEGLESIKTQTDFWFAQCHFDKKCVAYCMDSDRIDITIDGKRDIIANGAETDDNDIITVVCDCNKWISRFYKNDVNISGDFKIKENKTYHAVFTIWGGRKASFQVIEPSMKILEEMK